MRSVFLKSVYVCGAAIAPKGLQILDQSEICSFLAPDVRSEK